MNKNDIMCFYFHTPFCGIIHKYIYIYGGGAPNGFSGCSIHLPLELAFTPHFQKIVVDVKS